MRIEIHVDKLYRYERKAEPCFIGIPMKKGTLYDLDKVAVLQNNSVLPIQKKVTARHDDGSVKFMFLRFLADLPANKDAVLICDTNAQEVQDADMFVIETVQGENGICVDTGAVAFAVENNSDGIFRHIRRTCGRRAGRSLH